LSRTRTLFATLALALAVPAGIIGCGGDDSSDEDPQEILTATFNNDEPATSGVLDISVGVTAGDQGSFDASLSGPFQSNPDDPKALPQFDLTASAKGEGQGQTVDFAGGLTVTEDNAYVTYQDQAYEVGTDTFDQFKTGFEQQAAEQDGTSEEGAAAGLDAFKKQCESAVEAAGGDTSACDIDFASWFTNLSNDGTEDVEGTDSVHISGDVDTAKMFEDLSALSEASGESSGATADQLQQAQDAISSATVDVYSSSDSNQLTKLELGLSIDPSAVESPTPVPISGPIDFSFSVAIGDINSEQTIEAPSGAKPIDDLLGQFGGLGGLGALGGGTTVPDLGGSAGGAAGGGGSTGDANAYFDCIQQAGGDSDAIAACESKL
jgi:hypothetical protein